MKIRRHKRIQKTLNFYKTHMDFHPPYTILIDGTFCRAALEGKVNIKEQFPNIFLTEVNIVTTQCIIMEIERLSKLVKDLYGAWMIIKQFKTHFCGHKKDPKSAAECIKSMIGKKNPQKYILATMDQKLRTYFRVKVAGAPIMYLHRQTPMLEKPSTKSSEFFTAQKGMSTNETERLQEVKKKVLGEDEEAVKKKRKKKNPHPLSCLKSKKIKSITQNSEHTKRKRRKTKKEDIATSIQKVFSDK